MATIHRRGRILPVSKIAELATADDVNGTTDNTQAMIVPGGSRVIVVQVADGTAGTLGIDLIEISKDDGVTWSAADDGLAIDSDDSTGTVLAGGALNAAGTEPTGAAVFKFGPYSGPTAMRVSRATNWATGAPTVFAFLVGGNDGGAPDFLA